MNSVHKWIQPTQEKTNKPNPKWGIASAMELGPDKDLKPPQKPQKLLLLSGHCATIHNGNNMISVHEQIHPTQETTKKTNSEWGITSTVEMGANQDLKFLGNAKTFCWVTVEQSTMATT